MQFSAITTMVLLAATAASALPEPKFKLPKFNKPKNPSNGGGAGSSWKWDAASLAISTADLATSLSSTFKGDSGACEDLNKGSGCWKGYCWSACNKEHLQWWAWTANTPGGQDWITCSSDYDCKQGAGHISQEGCGC